MRRFYAPVENFNNSQVTLNIEETRHLRDVLRLRMGEEIAVFDGHGKEFLCKIETIEKKESHLKIIEEILPKSPESNLNLTLAVAILKGEKFDLVIQKAVELGVSKFVPIFTKRCDVKLKDNDKKLERWQRIILEASKQSGRAKLMEIESPINFESFVKKSDGENFVLFSERNGENFSAIKSSLNITAIIGSEGGWEDSEIELAQKKGIQIITLGGRILRAETAVIAISALLQNHFGDLN
ncbi:MAG TPA: 16S rRNA (uracil(1498)-N(3))-methyltransferase [Pyrinomonadaceae bacterium]|nr:16S rRNA (uracil(1498)-N(3))-methyltransferase [Pyrinomonadaceae bacterium]